MADESVWREVFRGRSVGISGGERSSQRTCWLSSAPGGVGHDAQVNSVDWEAQMGERDVPNGRRDACRGRGVLSGKLQDQHVGIPAVASTGSSLYVGAGILGCEDKQAESTGVSRRQ